MLKRSTAPLWVAAVCFLSMNVSATPNPRVSKLLSADEIVQQSAILDLKNLSMEAKRDLVPDLIAAAQSKDVLIQIRAARAIAMIGPAAINAEPALADAMSSLQPLLRASAANALGELGPGAKPALPLLARALSDPETNVRLAAAAAIGHFGDIDSKTLQVLMHAAEDPNPDVRLAAQQSLRTIYARGQTSSDKIDIALQSSDAQLRARAISAFAYGRPDEAGLEKIIRASQDPEPAVRIASALAIGQISQSLALTSANPALVRQKAAAALLSLLHDKEASVRKTALLAMSTATASTPGDASTLEAVYPALKDSDPDVRQAAVNVVFRQRPIPKALYPKLEKALHDPSAGVRGAAANALAFQYPLPDDLIPLLVPLIDDPDATVQSTVLRALANAKTIPAKALPHLTKVMTSKSGASLQALPLIMRMNVPNETAPILLRAFDDPDLQIHQTSVQNLSYWQYHPQEIIAGLRSRSKDLSFQWRLDALQILVIWQQTDEEITAAIVRGLDSGSDVDKEKYLRMLSQANKCPETLMPRVAPLARSADVQLRQALSQTLGSCRSNRPQAVAGLITLMKETDEKVRQAALSSLTAMGTDAKPAIPAVVDWLKKADDETKAMILSTLPGIDPQSKAVADVCLEFLNNPNPKFREAASGCLVRCDAGDIPDQPVLALLKDENPTLQRNGLYILARFKQLPPQALDPVIRLTDSPDAQVQNATLQVLSSQRPLPARMVSFFLDKVKTGPEVVRLQSLRLLGEADVLPPAAVEPLIATLERDDRTGRLLAIQALTKVRPMTSNVVHALEAQKHSKDPSVARSAAMALDRIRIVYRSKPQVSGNEPSLPKIQILGMTVLKDEPAKLTLKVEVENHDDTPSTVECIDTVHGESSGYWMSSNLPIQKGRHSYTSTIGMNPGAAPAAYESDGIRCQIFSKGYNSAVTFQDFALAKKWKRPPADKSVRAAVPNKIDAIRVVGDTGDRIAVAVDYSYSGDHGKDGIVIDCDPYTDAGSAPFGMLPGWVEVGRHSLQVPLTAFAGTPANSVSTIIRCVMKYRPDDLELAVKTVPFRKRWKPQ